MWFKKNSCAASPHLPSFPKNTRGREGFDMATFFTMGSASSTHGHEDVAPLELGYNKLLNILLRHF
jgi:hypothetical protein